MGKCGPRLYLFCNNVSGIKFSVRWGRGKGALPLQYLIGTSFHCDIEATCLRPPSPQCFSCVMPTMTTNTLWAQALDNRNRGSWSIVNTYIAGC